MAATESVASNIELTATMIKELGKAFAELESHRESTAKVMVPWTEIEEHFLNLENLCKKRLDELVEKQKILEEKESQTMELLVHREAEVAKKEQALLDHLQELKDASVAAIVEARMKFKIPSPEPTDVEIAEKKVSSPSHGEPLCAIDGKSPDKLGQYTEAVPTEVKPHPELIQLCEQMDPKGVLKFVSENQKDLSVLRDELPLALKSAPEPARLVLDSLDGFFPSDLTATTHQGNMGNPALMGFRRSCILLLESLAPLLVVDMELDNPVVSADTKQQAKAIADDWKPKLALEVGMDGASSSLEAQAFLQLLATFGISSEFDEDELCKLVLAVSNRRQTTDLCRYLGLTHKMPDIIQTMVKIGRQVDAVHFIQAFQLADKYPPVPLLKEYLRDVRRNSQGNGASGGGQNEVNAQELAALKVVIGCVEEYKFESQYPLDPLQKRVGQLEKAKTDRKRTGNSPTKVPPMKRGRAHGGFGRGRHQRPPSTFGGRGRGYGGPGRHPYAAPPAYNYVPPVPPVPPSQPIYSQQQPAVQPSYYYQDERPPAPTTYGAPQNYGGYAGSGGYPSHQSYM